MMSLVLTIHLFFRTEPARDKANVTVFQETWLLALCLTLLTLIIVVTSTVAYIKIKKSKRRKAQNSNSEYSFHSNLSHIFVASSK